MRVRQDRLGQVDLKTTLQYTHAISSDARAVAERLGRLFNQVSEAGFSSRSLAQVLPKSETAWEANSQAVENADFWVAGGGF